MAERRVVAVVSGGLDSTTMAYRLRADGDELLAISFDYGQRHRKELTFAERVATDLDAPWTLIDLHAAGVTSFLTGSALTDSTVAVPDGHYADESMQATVVPNRNAIMLSIACALAITENASAVAFGAHAGDHFIYPDCRPGFVSAFEAMVNLAVEGLGELQILAPLLSMTKTDIVRLGDELGVPFERTWSFAQANVCDPTAYEGESAPAR